jgi:hypothetical protein
MRFSKSTKILTAILFSLLLLKSEKSFCYLNIIEESGRLILESGEQMAVGIMGIDKILIEQPETVPFYPERVSIG